MKFKDAILNLNLTQIDLPEQKALNSIRMEGSFLSKPTLKAGKIFREAIKPA